MYKRQQLHYKTENSFRSRLYTIANNTLLDSYKKQNPESLDEDLDYESQEDITKEENNRYISEQILHELDQLGTTKKDIIIMRLRE